MLTDTPHIQSDKDQTPVVTLITGASAGIGKATASVLNTAARSADTLLLTGREAERLSAAETDIGAEGAATIKGMVCDQGSQEAVETLCEAVQSLEPAQLRIVANVGWNPVHSTGPKKLQNTDPDVIRQSLDLNVTMTAYLIARLLPVMRSSRYGRIVIVGSQAYRYGIPGQIAYNLAKSALVGLKNTVVSEYAGSGVFCHLVEPGIVLNDRTRRLRSRLAAGRDDQFVTEEAVAGAIAELLSVDVAEENGQVVTV